jgi:hypothetical protein
LIVNKPEKIQLENQYLQCQLVTDLMALGLIDNLCLIAMENNHPVTFEEIREIIQKEFKIIFPQETFFWALFLMEDKNLIVSESVNDDIVYTLTALGTAFLRDYKRRRVEILDFMASVQNEV